MTKNKKLQDLIDMSADEFKDAVMQAFKKRQDFPRWWAAVLAPELIDATERVLRGVLVEVDAQAANRARFPQAASFAFRLRHEALIEVRLQRASEPDEE